MNRKVITALVILCGVFIGIVFILRATATTNYTEENRAFIENICNLHNLAIDADLRSQAAFENAVLSDPNREEELRPEELQRIKEYFANQRQIYNNARCKEFPK